jgi:dCTP deaminase
LPDNKKKEPFVAAGVLNAQQVTTRLLSGDSPCIKSAGGISIQPKESSMDLPLGSRYWEMPASVRPDHRQEVTDVISKFKGVEKPLVAGTVFRTNRVYLVEIPWSLALPAEISARSTAKSSIGRLDVLVRLVTDNQPEFDRVSAGTRTKLYVEVAPLTFDIKVSPGLSLSQIRFIRGDEEFCTVPCRALAHEDTPVLVYSDGTPHILSEASGDHNGVLLSLDASPDPALGFLGFKAKARDELQGQGAIDLSIKAPKLGEPDLRPDPTAFWDPVSAFDGGRSLKIERERFYILRSKERFRIPPHLAVECQAYSESLGDIRIHYAGFAHPFFGFDREMGTPLIFEVRGFSMDTILRDGAPLAKVYFWRMSDAAVLAEDNPYNKQELKLSTYFQDWPARA